MMGTFAAAYPHVSGGSSLVPALLGALFLGSGGWFGLSADLTAYLDRQRPGGMTTYSRLVTAGLLALAMGVPAFGLTLTSALQASRGGYRQAETTRRTAPIPVPPQSREGAEFARDLIERALRAQDYAVITAAMPPEVQAQITPEQTRQTSVALARHGPPQGMELSDVFFNMTHDRRRELTYCNVFAVCADRRVCFHCYVSREVGTPGWQVDMVTIE